MDRVTGNVLSSASVRFSYRYAPPCRGKQPLTRRNTGPLSFSRSEPCHSSRLDVKLKLPPALDRKPGSLKPLQVIENGEMAICLQQNKSMPMFFSSLPLLTATSQPKSQVVQSSSENSVMISDSLGEVDSHPQSLSQLELRHYNSTSKSCATTRKTVNLKSV